MTTAAHSVRVISNENHFQGELAAAGVNLVVAYFTAQWCGPCQRMGPLYELLPPRFPKAIFLKVDVDKCQDTAAGQGVSAMPTFIFYRNRNKVERLQGVDIRVLEGKIQEHISSGLNEESGEDYGPGMMDLSSFIMGQECECLNETDDHTMKHCLTSGGGYLQSDCDEQLILSITFNQAVKIHSIKFKAPAALGPKNVKLFINQPRTIDFDMAESMTSNQDLELSIDDLINGTPVGLRFVKFQNVQNIQVFVRNNQNGGDVTQIDNIVFIGTPILTTKMTEFKRISGKKGEKH